MSDNIIVVFRRNSATMDNTIMTTQVDNSPACNANISFYSWNILPLDSIIGQTFGGLFLADCFILHGNNLFAFWINNPMVYRVGYMKQEPSIEATVAKMVSLRNVNYGDNYSTMYYANARINSPVWIPMNVNFKTNLDDIFPDDWPSCFLFVPPNDPSAKIPKTTLVSQAADINAFRSQLIRENHIIFHKTYLVSLRRLGFDLNALVDL